LFGLLPPYAPEGKMGISRRCLRGSIWCCTRGYRRKAEGNWRGLGSERKAFPPLIPSKTSSGCYAVKTWTCCPGNLPPRPLLSMGGKSPSPLKKPLRIARVKGEAFLPGNTSPSAQTAGLKNERISPSGYQKKSPQATKARGLVIYLSFRLTTSR
jgi:hypothetical protein